MTNTLATLLAQSSALHKHLCPRQVLGVRMGMHAADLLGIDLPQTNKRLLTFVETDGCFADGVSTATGCWLGRRTLRLIDHGKAAATFLDTHVGRALRIHPSVQARHLAPQYAPNAQSRWHAYLEAYQVMPIDELLAWDEVQVMLDIPALISKAGSRTTCATCGEEILNEREIICGSETLCRACAGQSYVQQVLVSPKTWLVGRSYEATMSL